MCIRDRYETLRDEIVEMVGLEPYQVLCDYVKERGHDQLLPHPAVRRRTAIT